MRDDRLTGLDFMRALAAGLVVTHHLVLRLDYGKLTGPLHAAYPTLLMGAFGVAVFFLLSGYLLTRPFWLAYDAGKPMPSLKTYAVRRAARIVPAYYVALAVAFALSILWFGTPVTGELLMRLVAGFLFVGEFHPVTLFPVEFDGPLWSIGMEVSSYVMLPLGLIALFSLRRWLPGWRGRLTFLGALALALLGHYLIKTYVPVVREGWGWEHGLTGGAKYWYPAYNPIGFFAFFAMGGLSAGLSVLWRGRHPVADLVVIAALALGGAVMWWVGPRLLPESLGWLSEPYAFPWFHLAVAAALIAFPHTRYLPVIAESRPIVFLARISFGIYIWHMLIIELVRKQFEPAVHFYGMSDIGLWTLLSAVVIGLSIAMATLSWHFLEKPILDWARGREGKSGAPVAQEARAAL